MSKSHTCTSSALNAVRPSSKNHYSVTLGSSNQHSNLQAELAFLTACNPQGSL